MWLRLWLKIEECDSVCIKQPGSCFVYPRLTWEPGTRRESDGAGLRVSESAPAPALAASRSHHLGRQSSPSARRGRVCDNIIIVSHQ